MCVCKGEAYRCVREAMNWEEMYFACWFFVLCSEGEVFGEPLLFQPLHPSLLQTRGPAKDKKIIQLLK